MPVEVQPSAPEPSGLAPPVTRRSVWRWRAATAALYASLALVLIRLGFTGSVDNRLDRVVGVAWDTYGVLSVVFAAWAWRHRGLDRTTRRAWGLVAVGFLLFEMSSVLREFTPVGTVFPSAADLLRLLFIPVVLAGMLLLPMRVRTRWGRGKAWLDATVVIVASAMLLWELNVGTSVAPADRVPPAVLAAALAYPVTDLVLLFGALVVAMRGAAMSARRPAALLGVATLALLVGDTFLGYRQSRATTTISDTWQFACWLTGTFLLTMAAFEQCRQASRHRLLTEESQPRAVGALLYLGIGLGYALLLWACVNVDAWLAGPVIGAMVITAAVVTRQVVALYENRELQRQVSRHVAALEQTNKDLEAFSYTVTHDLRAPLRVINRFAQIIIDKDPRGLDEQTRHYLQRICRNATGMDELISHILAFSQMSRTGMDMTSVDMTALAREAYEQARAAVADRTVVLRLGDLPPARGDPAMVYQVWVNLLGNAVKYTGPRAEAVIEVGGAVVGEESVYRVRDNGVGFDMRYAEKLFAAFERLHRADEFEGTGLGLATVQRIVTRHGGRVWAEGEVDKGATVYFTLPNDASASRTDRGR